MTGEAQKMQDEIIGEGVPFSRIRRITGYLVGDMGRWNDAKKSEESERVKHIKSVDEYNPSSLSSPSLSVTNASAVFCNADINVDIKEFKCKKIA